MSLSYLTRFAVSDYLKTSNSELLDRLVSTHQDYDGSIPIAVIEDKFSNVLSQYEDVEADLLVTNPNQYLLHTSPLSFVQTEEGVTVAGDIDDRILYVIEQLHGQPLEEIVQTHIYQSVQTLNPDREVVITSLTLGEKVQQFSERVRQHAEWLHQVEVDDSHLETAESQALETEDHATVVHDEVEEIHTENFANEQDVPKIDIEKEVINHEETLSNIEESSEKVIEKVQEGLSDQQVTDAVDVLSNVYNQFIQSLKDTGIAERVAFDEPLALAL